MIRASTAERSEAKFEEKILAVSMAEPGSMLYGTPTVKFTAEAVVLSKIWDPREPPRDTKRGKPLGSTLTGKVKLSSNLMPL
jgi:hypothetical protein